MNINKNNILKNNTLLEKILLAYWYSIPGDNDIAPDKIKIVGENNDFFQVNLIKNDTIFGFSTIRRNEILKYLEKLEKLKEHEIDVIERLEREIAQS